MIPSDNNIVQEQKTPHKTIQTNIIQPQMIDSPIKSSNKPQILSPKKPMDNAPVKPEIAKPEIFTKSGRKVITPQRYQRNQ